MMIAKSRFSKGWHWKIVGGAALTALLIDVNPIIAQVVPDNTLDRESSIVTPNVTIRGIGSDRIEGGAIRGANLFHSFSQFNVGEGRGAYFANPSGINNILSRVTGANRSDILGRLGVLGTANLFLINPNGIVFGAASSLDVQGSFLATTANAVKLGDTGLFSASQPATSNLLSVSPSAFWFNAVAAQPIVNRSRAESVIGQPNSADIAPGLQVQPERTIALVGGDVLLEGGKLATEEGRVELGSVAGVGQVSLTQSGNRFVLGYDSINGFGKISLSDGALVNVRGSRGGEVQIRGRRLELSQISNIVADSLREENAGQILIGATEVDVDTNSSLTVNAYGLEGNGGGLTINTERFLIHNGALVSSRSFSGGRGGNVQINAEDSVEVRGPSIDGGGGLYAESFRSGDAGNVSINTKRLIVGDEGEIAAESIGSGKGGNVEINALDSVEVIGALNDRVGGTLSTRSFRSGDAGNVSIDTRRLSVRDGGRILTDSQGSGKGGNVEIKASDAIEVIGSLKDNISTLSTRSSGSGAAGDIRIDTRMLLLRDKAALLSNSTGMGAAGNVSIAARDNLQLENGAIRTDSTQTQGGSITIEAGKIRLFSNSDIKSNVASGVDNGGNITLTAGSILALGDSDILAFARNGRGGNITLNTAAFFGENYRPAPPGTNPQTLEENNRVDINATGAVSGIVTIPDVSFIQNSLTELTDTQINTDSILANSCIVRRNQATRGRFTISGTGGFSQRPGDAQISSFPTVSVEMLPSDSQPPNSSRAWQKGDAIVEPQGVYRLPNGKVVLSRNCP